MSSASRAALFALVTLFPLGCAHRPGTADTSAICAHEATEHVEYLASPELEGRGVGTEGLRRAAYYIAQQFQQLGLQPGGLGKSYLQPFFVPALGENSRMTLVWNVVGYLPGSKDSFSNEAVVLGAHYDHLGYGKPAAWNVHGCKGAKAGLLYPGADDNASGVAALLAVAKAFAKDRSPRPRGVVFVAFAAEEMGLLGSRHFVEHLPKPISEVTAMINFDMVGRLRADQGLTVEGANTGDRWWELLKASNQDGVRLRGVETLVEDSDHAPFYRKDRPVLFFFTGMHGDYHCFTDTPDAVSGESIATVAKLAYRVAHRLAFTDAQKAALAFVRVKIASRSQGFGGPRLGLMPDYGVNGGLGIYGVLPGGPAERAGLKEGDVIVGIGKEPIRNIEDYMGALARLSAGQTIAVEVLRAGRKEVFRVELNRTVPSLPPSPPVPVDKVPLDRTPAPLPPAPEPAAAP